MVFSDFFDSLLQIMATRKTIFLGDGLQFANAVMLLTILMLGWKALFTGLDGRTLWKAFWGIVIMQTVMQCYDRPIPFLGISATRLVTDETALLARKLTMQADSEVFDALSLMQDGAAAPEADASWLGLPSFKAAVIWCVIELVLCILTALVWAVIAWGYIAQALCLMVGPMLIPFGLVPGFEWLAWGWVKSFIQYSLYGVFAAGYTVVASALLTHFVVRNPPPWNTTDEWLMLGPLFIMLGALGAGAFQVGSLASSVCSGRAGETAVPRFVRNWA